MKRVLSPHQSMITAAIIAVALVLWLFSGGNKQASAKPATDAATSTHTAKPFAVRVRSIAAKDIARDIIIYARTEPARTVTLRSEIDGRVIELGAQRGTLIEKGELVIQLDARDLKARHEQAKALVKQRTMQYQAALRLEERKYQSPTALAQAIADLAAAKASVAQVQVAIDNTEVRAPFSGLLESRAVEIGDFLTEGKEVARIIDNHPLIVAGYVTQQELSSLKLNAQGSAELVTGEKRSGHVRYISSQSDEQTRTFLVELAIDNHDHAMVAGVTAEVRVATPSVRAHLISPALLSLNELEQVGVLSVSESDKVQFAKINLLRSEAQGIWVTGLSEHVRVITVGQGFVRVGDTVTAVEEIPATANGDAQSR